MKFDLGFIHRVYRETAWFAPLIALVMYFRGFEWTVWVGVIAGAALALMVFLSVELLVIVATAPGDKSRLIWLKLMNLLLLPMIAIMLYLYIPVFGLNVPAIAGGVTVPLVVGALKAVGKAWGDWAADGRPVAGPSSEPEE
ncbi:MAG: hypothetical protein GF320_03160 [Armatimonadia bacterium]|nr:hypothetical protein [Armatimonadia bacterium]